VKDEVREAGDLPIIADRYEPDQPVAIVAEPVERVRRDVLGHLRSIEVQVAVPQLSPAIVVALFEVPDHLSLLRAAQSVHNASLARGGTLPSTQ
jgi:hypothetical protein